MTKKRHIMSNFYKKFQDPAISQPNVWPTYKTNNYWFSKLSISVLINYLYVIGGVMWAK